VDLAPYHELREALLAGATEPPPTDEARSLWPYRTELLAHLRGELGLPTEPTDEVNHG
jgi:hypothetical protein